MNRGFRAIPGGAKTPSHRQRRGRPRPHGVRVETRLPPRDIHDAPHPSQQPSPLGVISPELALIDPELAEVARRNLPPVELWEPRPWPAPLPPERASRRPPRARAVVRSIALKLPVLAAAFGLGALAASIGSHSSGVATPSITTETIVRRAAPAPGASGHATTTDRHPKQLPPRTSTAATATPTPHRPRPKTTTGTTPAAPKSGVTTGTATTPEPTTRKRAPQKPVARTGGRLIRWGGPGAPYYNVVLWHDGKRIFDSWPTVKQVTIPSSWRNAGTRYRLSPGTYLWFVYPGIGSRASGRYGGLAASGSFTIR